MVCKRAILCVTGLGKSHLFRRKGLVALFWELQEIVGPETKVGLYAWNGYEEILRDLKCWKPDEVYPIGHSYGASTGNFVCKALLEYPNVRVPHATYCDLVGRDEILRIDRDSLDANRQEIIASNVEKLSTLEQDRQPISGHDCIIGPSTIYVHREVVTDRRHAFLDRHPRFRELAMEAILGS